MKTIFKTLVIALLSVKALAQQRPQYSQYMMNQYLLNPAVGGTSEDFDIKVGARQQWFGLGGNDAPRLFYLSANGHLGQHLGPNKGRSRRDKDRFHGVGGMAVVDQTGPTSRTSAYLSYSYNMPLTRKLRISFGAFAGVQQFTIEGEKLKFTDNQVGAVLPTMSQMMPDASIGIWLYSDKYFIGASMMQILQNKLEFNNMVFQTTQTNRLNSHYFITGGLNLPMGPDFSFVPSILGKFVWPALPSVDLNAKLKYKDLFWLGASFRTAESVVSMIGCRFGTFEFGYSFDYIYGKLGNSFNYGSHEIVLGYRLDPGNKIRSPSDFW